MKHAVSVLSLALLGLGGCTSHLIFVEEDHVGLKAQFEANNPSPTQFSLGYRRGIVAVIPQQSDASEKSPSMPVKANTDPATKVITVTSNPNDLMSLYTVFRANVGFNNPTEIRHFLATGTAAVSLLADNAELRSVVETLNRSNAQKGGGQ